MDYGLKGESIICFAGEDWWYHHPHGRKHLLRRLAAENRILFINSLTMGPPSVSNPDFFLKIRRKFKSYFRWLRRVPEGIYVMTPVIVPLFGSRWLRWLNGILLYGQVRLAQWWCGLRDPILWIHIPSAVDVCEKLNAKAVLYHVTDKLAATEDSALSPVVILDFDRRLKRLADVVIYAGRLLYDEAREPHRVLLQHGVDFDHFSAGSATPAADIASLPHPVLGYFGQIEYTMDLPLIREVLRRRPDWCWAMVGFKSNVVNLEAPNLHFLGPKPYHDLPDYICCFDVCILPWRQEHTFTKYGSAIKVREYLATGKPVVMSPLSEYVGTPGVRFFHNGDEFIAAVEDALANDPPAERALRQSVVRHPDWDDRTRQCATIINTVLAAKKAGKPVDFDRLRLELSQEEESLRSAR
jgi:glycosyltransferase involved in cell wall biosynthesis